MSITTVTFGTDEDLFVQAPDDWENLVPNNLYAAGADGVLAGWTLTSASNNFPAQGIKPGMIVQVFPPPARNPADRTAVFTPLGPTESFHKPRFFAVDTVATNSLTLRQPGDDPGFGMPPAPGGASNVTFEIKTALPQVRDAAVKLDQQFDVDPKVVTRTPGDIYDATVLNRASAFRVLYLLYEQANRSTEGDYTAKMKEFADLYSTEVDQAVVRWGPVGTSQPPSSRIGCRLSR